MKLSTININITLLRFHYLSALKYHPDQAGSAPDTLEAFRRVQDAYGVLSRAPLKKSYDMTRRMAVETNKATTSLARHAEALKGENMLKNVEFSRPASEWTGTREKYRHETWQSLSLNVKKAKRVAPMYSFPGIPQFAVRVGLPVAIVLGAVGVGIYYTVGRGGVERMEENTKRFKLELTGKSATH